MLDYSNRNHTSNEIVMWDKDVDVEMTVDLAADSWTSTGPRTRPTAVSS